MKNVKTVNFPKESKCRDFIEKVDFEDAYQVKLRDSKMQMEDIYFGLFAYMPKWIGKLLWLRNKAVGVFGLDTGKNDEELVKENIKVGKKIGLFTVYDIQPNEIIAGENDKHLNFRVSILKQNTEVIVITLVQYNNTFGKVYMNLIMPFHKLVVKSMLNSAVKNNRI